MNDNDDWGYPPPVKTNLTADLQRAFNYGWKAAMEHVYANKHTVESPLAEISRNGPQMFHEIRTQNSVADKE